MKKLNVFFLAIIFVFAFSCNNEEATNEAGNDVKNENAATEAVVYNTAEEMVEAAKTQIEEITVEKLKELMDADESYLLLDIRTESERNQGFITGSVHIPRGVLEFRIKKESFWEEQMLYMPAAEDLIIVQCKSGLRGALAALTLKQMGFKNAKNLIGGFVKFNEMYPDMVTIPEGATTGGDAHKDSGGC